MKDEVMILQVPIVYPESSGLIILQQSDPVVDDFS